MRSHRAAFVLLWIAAGSLPTSPVAANDEDFVRDQTLGSPTAGGSKSPYIDKLKRNLEAEEDAAKGTEESFIEKTQREIKDADRDTKIEHGDDSSNNGTSSTPYIDKLKGSDPDTRESIDDSLGYSDREKKKIAPKTEGGAIARVREGKSALEKKKEGDSRNAFSLRVGVSQDPKISANAATQANSFNDVYGNKRWYPDFTVHYEWDLFNHSYAGAFGLFAQGSFGTFSGNGRFAVPLTTVGNTSRTAFRFVVVPITVGAVYRLNVLQYVKPYAMVGPTLINYAESRDDGKPTLLGYSKGYTAVGGVAIQLDWINDSSDWNLYSTYGIKHTYLMVEGYRTASVSSDVTFTLTGFNLGFMFEF